MGIIEEKLENVTILLNKKRITKATTTHLLTKSETFSAVAGQRYEPAGNQVMCNIVLYIVKWLVSVTEYQWFIGYVKQEVENGFVIDHLYQVSEKETHSGLIPPLKTFKLQRKEKSYIVKLKVNGI